MRNSQLFAVASMYRDHLEKLGIETREDGLPLQHCRWMCGQIIIMLGPCPDKDPPVGPEPRVVQKAHRWLGFIQGVLYSEKVFTILQMRDHNRAPEDT